MPDCSSDRDDRPLAICQWQGARFVANEWGQPVGPMEGRELADRCCAESNVLDARSTRCIFNVAAKQSLALLLARCLALAMQFLKQSEGCMPHCQSRLAVVARAKARHVSNETHLLMLPQESQRRWEPNKMVLGNVSMP
jgi:hypothetical protein